jgi:hypothetical protein
MYSTIHDKSIATRNTSILYLLPHMDVSEQRSGNTYLVIGCWGYKAVAAISTRKESSAYHSGLIQAYRQYDISSHSHDVALAWALAFDISTRVGMSSSGG